MSKTTVAIVQTIVSEVSSLRVAHLWSASPNVLQDRTAVLTWSNSDIVSYRSNGCNVTLSCARSSDGLTHRTPRDSSPESGPREALRARDVAGPPDRRLLGAGPGGQGEGSRRSSGAGAGSSSLATRRTRSVAWRKVRLQTEYGTSHRLALEISPSSQNVFKCLPSAGLGFPLSLVALGPRFHRGDLRRGRVSADPNVLGG